jgi:hypothetical protein
MATGMISSWCPGQGCDPCKAKSLFDGFPPPPVPGIEVFYYLIQDMISTVDGTPTGGSALVGIGSQIFTLTITGPFGWSYGPYPLPATQPGQSGFVYDGGHIEIAIHYFDTGDTLPVDGKFATIEEALAIGEEFNQYYFG